MELVRLQYVKLKLRSPLKTFGGKSYLARRFISLFPDHDVFLETHAGGLSVLLNRSPSSIEVASDLNGPLMNAWRTLRGQGEAVLPFLRDEVEYSREWFDWAGEAVDDDSDALLAIKFIIRNRMSRGGLGRDFAWSDRLRGGQPGDVNAWKTMVEEDLPRVIERIRGVDFREQDALEVIRDAERYRDRRVLLFADPPYLHNTRTTRDAYDHEMSEDDHFNLVSALIRASEWGAKVFLCGYESPQYREWVPPSWEMHTFSMPNHSGQGKTKNRRVECLWES